MMAGDAHSKDVQEAQRYRNQIQQIEAKKREHIMGMSTNAQDLDLTRKFDQLIHTLDCIQLQLLNISKEKSVVDDKFIFGEPKSGWRKEGNKFMLQHTLNDQLLLHSIGMNLISSFPNLDFPKFDGTRLRHWVLECQEYFNLMPNLSDAQKVNLASMNFGGKAAEWYQNLSITRVEFTWDQFVDLLSARFEELRAAKLSIQLNKLRQTDSYIEYVKKFEDIKSCLLMLNKSDYTEEYFIACFRNGLSTEKQVFVNLFKPTTLQQIIELGEKQSLTAEEVLPMISKDTSKPSELKEVLISRKMDYKKEDELCYTFYVPFVLEQRCTEMISCTMMTEEEERWHMLTTRGFNGRQSFIVSGSTLSSIRELTARCLRCKPETTSQLPVQVVEDRKMGRWVTIPIIVYKGNRPGPKLYQMLHSDYSPQLEAVHRVKFKAMCSKDKTQLEGLLMKFKDFADELKKFHELERKIKRIATVYGIPTKPLSATYKKWVSWWTEEVVVAPTLQRRVVSTTQLLTCSGGGGRVGRVCTMMVYDEFCKEKLLYVIDPSKKKLGSYLIQSQFQSAGNFSGLFLTAAAQNLMSLKLAEKLGVVISNPWISWFKAASLPAFVSLLATPFILYKLYAPEIIDTPDAPAMATKRLELMGPVTKNELVMIGTMLHAVSLWIFGDALRIASVVAAMLGLSILLLLGVLNWDDCLSEKSAWDTLAWFAVLSFIEESTAKSVNRRQEATGPLHTEVIYGGRIGKWAANQAFDEVSLHFYDVPSLYKILYSTFVHKWKKSIGYNLRFCVMRKSPKLEGLLVKFSEVLVEIANWNLLLQVGTLTTFLRKNSSKIDPWGQGSPEGGGNVMTRREDKMWKLGIESWMGQ